VDAVIEGYCARRRLTQPEVERLADAVRFRPLVVAAREFATALERDEAAEVTAWWNRYVEAEAVAARAKAAVRR
jgi:hypothetical protein